MHCCGTVNWCSHYGNQPGGSSKKLKTPCNPAIPLWGIYLRKTKTLTRKDICTTIFIAALFVIAKIWKQPKCPSIEEWLKKMWYVYITLYLCLCLQKTIIQP